MELRDFIDKYKDKILDINIAIIILALIIAINIYKIQNRIIGSLEKQRDIEIKKNELLNNISQSEKNINKYKNYLRKKDVALVMNAITDIARQANIKIILFKPQPEQDYRVYIMNSFYLVINAKDYHRLGKFISKIESLPDIYMINSLNIKPLSQEEMGDEDTNKISAELRLTTFFFKG